MPEFAIPDEPASEALYNAVLNAEVELVELRRQYHEAECAELDRLWNASNSHDKTRRSDAS